MDYILLKDFLAHYSLPTLVIASVCTVFSLICDRFLKNKLPKLIRSYAPFILAILLYFAFDMIFVFKAFVFSENSLYAGILSGSLSFVIFKAIKKIASGKNLTLTATALLIEGLLEGYVNQSAIGETALALDKLLTAQDKLDDQTAVTEVLLTLKDKSEINRTEEELFNLAILIVSAVKSLCDN